MDYNTQREKLLMPEYGRHIQKMVEQIKQIPDKETRNKQVQAVLDVMLTLKPQNKDVGEYKHKLWDHILLISNFELDIDVPYPSLNKEYYTSRPSVIHNDREPLRAKHYGRNIINMIDIVATMEEGEEKNAVVKDLATYMRKHYLIWNKNTVSQETIFNDIKILSGGKLIVDDSVQLSALSDKENFSKPKIINVLGNSNSKDKNARTNKKKWKK